MRTTLDIDADVLQAAKDLARREHSSAGAVISRLARDALTGRGATSRQRAASSGRTVAGFRPFPVRGKLVADEAIDALRDAEGV